MRIELRPVMEELQAPPCRNCLTADATHHLVHFDDHNERVRDVGRNLGVYCTPCIHLLGRCISNAAQKVGA